VIVSPHTTSTFSEELSLGCVESFLDFFVPETDT